jgi:hypothetical protein
MGASAGAARLESLIKLEGAMNSRELHHPNRPTWELLREVMAGSARSDAGKKAGLWALQVLEGELGRTWPERAWEAGGERREILLAAGHTLAFVDVVELALRLTVLHDVPGLARVRRGLRTDYRGGFWAHATIQLQLAALARQLGWKVAMEKKQRPGGRPTDVIVSHSGHTLTAETFAVLLDDRTRSAHRHDYEIERRILQIQLRHDVSVSGQVTERLPSEETEAWLEELEVAAAQVAREGLARTVDRRIARVRIMPAADAPPGTSLTGPIAERDGWFRTDARLREKAAQARLSGARWLRADVLDGLWQFTPWARWSLDAKVRELTGAVREAVGQTDPLDGVVLSSGLVWAQGEFAAESVRTGEGAIGVRHLVRPIRVRELIIIPTSPDGLDSSLRWAELYESEEGWLDVALNEVGLASAEKVLASSQPQLRA